MQDEDWEPPAPRPDGVCPGCGVKVAPTEHDESWDYCECRRPTTWTTLITNPRAHFKEQTGVALSDDAASKWVCDICEQQMNPDKPILEVGFFSVCSACLEKAPERETHDQCQCKGCNP